MGRLGLALKVLFNGRVAKQVSDALAAPAALPEPVAPPEPPKPKRSEAVTLMAAFQREARFVDFLQEPIDGYNDAQVGAAAREIHRGCKEVVERMFAPAPLVDQQEGSAIEVDDTTSGRFRLTGNVSQTESSVSGQLVHHGWQASKCNVPEWTGGDDATTVVAPAEVQVG